MSKATRNIIIIAMVVIAAALAAVIIYGRNSASDDISVKISEAEAFYEALDYDKAIAAYNDILSTEDNADAYAGLAKAYYAKGNSEKALNVLEKGLESTQNNDAVVKVFSELFPDAETAEATTTSVATSETEKTTETSVSEKKTEEESVTTQASSESSATKSETSAATTVTASATTQHTTAAATAATTQKQTAAATTAATTKKETQTVVEKISVKSYTGLTEDAISSSAKSDGVNVVFVYEEDNSYIDGEAFKQSPAAGSKVGKGSIVTVYICKSSKKSPNAIIIGGDSDGSENEEIFPDLSIN